jgi:ketosteroid isomerase-like protein
MRGHFYEGAAVIGAKRRIAVGLVVLGIGGCVSRLPPGADEECPAAGGRLSDLTGAEVAFSRAAETSVRSAFLAVLADDSIVLQPEPHPGRKVWSDTPDNADRLSWYPAIAEVAASADLGFTTGPWVYTIAASGQQIQGSYLTVWKRAPQCSWHVVLDGGVSHAAERPPELHPDPGVVAPRWRAATEAQAGALSQAIQAFHAAASQGLGVVLADYSAPEFRGYANRQLPMDGAASAHYFAANPPKGSWQEALHAMSADGSLAYAYGELTDADQSRTAAYVEVWRFDPAQRRYRVRLLLVNAYPHPQPKGS